MNSLLIRYHPDCSDISLAARDLIISLNDSKRIAFAVEFGSVGDWWTGWPEYGSEEDPVTEAINRFVDDSAVCLHAMRARDIEIDQKRSNHAIVVNAEDSEDQYALAKLKLMDAIWCTSTSIKNRLERSGLRSKILVTGLPVALRHPSNLKLDEGCDVLCVESNENTTGLLGVARAWLRSDLADGKTLCIATTGPLDRTSRVKHELERIRQQEGHPRRKIKFADLPSPAVLDLMVEHSTYMIDCHLDRPSWRPTVLKAAMLRKPVIYCGRGELRNQISGGLMYEVDSELQPRYEYYDTGREMEVRMADAMNEPLRRLLSLEVQPTNVRHERSDGSLLANQKITGVK
jgi:hypothetical protein